MTRQMSDAGVVYAPRYNITLFGVERLHPFDSRKYGRAWAELRRRVGPKLAEHHLRPGGPVTDSDLRTVHTARYLDVDTRSTKYLARALELPPVARAPRWLINWRVLGPMRWATAGTILAAREALRRGGTVLNLSGGYHHASQGRGEGFSIFSDIGVAVAVLRRDNRLGMTDRILYIDLDAHQGNGVARVFAEDRSVFIFDLYNRQIYPNDAEARRRIDHDVPIPSGYDDARYLGALRRELPRFLDGIARLPGAAPRIAVYNAGTDILAGDPLGRLSVSADGVFERDRIVLTELARRKIPCVVLPSGGYTRESYKLIARTAEWLLTCSERGAKGPAT